MPYLKNIRVDFISLVERGANQKTIVWKSGEGEPPRTWDVPIAKTDPEKRLVYGIVYSPCEVDSQGDHTDAAEIERAAYDFLKTAKTANIDKDHSYAPEDGVFVAESWLTKSGDPIFPNDPEGSWAVAIKVENAALWDQVKAGSIGGLSMGGVAEKMEKSTSFNSAIALDGMWRYFSALETSIRSVLDDENETDKKAAISANIDQFKTTVLEQSNLTKGHGSGLLAKIKSFVIGDKDMTEADVKKLAGELVTDAIEKMEKPATLTKEDVTTIVTEAMKGVIAPLTDRLEKIEKQTPGSAQGDDPVTLEKTEKDLVDLGAAIAAEINKGR